MEKRRAEKKPPAKPEASELSAAGDSMPELWGVGAAPVGGGKWLAYRLSSRGEVVVLTPKRHGKNVGESKHSSVARATEAWRRLVASTNGFGEPLAGVRW